LWEDQFMLSAIVEALKDMDKAREKAMQKAGRR
jgi:hypothetical protein